MRRIVVTGAGGFIGKPCAERLVDSGYDVHLFTRRPLCAPGGATVHSIDLLSTDQIEAHMKSLRPTHLLHLAWYTKPGDFWGSPLNLEWLRATLALFDSFARNGGRRVIGVGTCAEYDSTGGVCAEDTTPSRPTSAYGRCKLAAAEALIASALARGHEAAWARIFSPYGPGESPEKLIPYTISTWLSGGTVRCGDLQRVRDFVFVDDVADGLVALTSSAAGGVFNICSGVPVALSEVLTRIGVALGGAGPVEANARPVALNDPLVLVGDPQKASSTLGWSARIDLAEGIRRATDYWKSVHRHGRARGVCP